MKDPLKKHIDENRKEFDLYQNDYELIWGNISRRLDQEEKKGSSVARNILKIAASILIILSIGISYYMGKRSVEFNQKGIALHNISSELAETEAYYIHLIDDQMEYINENKSQIDTQIFESIKQLDNDYEQLKKDLTDRADSEEVIDAMINYYRLKLNMLEQISDELKEKQLDDENINI